MTENTRKLAGEVVQAAAICLVNHTIPRLADKAMERVAERKAKRVKQVVPDKFRS